MPESWEGEQVCAGWSCHEAASRPCYGNAARFPDLILPLDRFFFAV